MKKLVGGAIGSDGSYELDIVDGKLQIAVGYNVEAILNPIKTHVFDAIKNAIPGNYEDAILDGLWNQIMIAVKENV